MKLADLQAKLLAAARHQPPRDHVPYAFEQRVLAHLADRPAVDLAALWSRALWRAAAPCVAITLTLAAWNFFPSANPATTSDPTPTTALTTGDDLSLQFEQSLMASAEPAEELW